jgi:hypothetical protein
MTKYLKEITISLVVSIVAFAVVAYTSGNIIASISVFTAVLVTINFILNRYESRNEAIVYFELINDDEGKPKFSVSLVNTGGKTIYFDTVGLKMRDGTIIDFDDDWRDKEPPPPPEKPKINRFGFSIPTLTMPMLRTPVLPTIRPIGFFSIYPGDARTVSKKVYDVLQLLRSKNYQFQDTLEIQGIFIDRLNYEHISEWKQFNLKELFDSIKKE